MATSPSERKQILAELVRLAGGDLSALWRRAEALDSNAFRAFLVDAFPALIDPYAAAAADLAATWYDDAAPELRYIAQPGPMPVPEQLQSSTTWALNTGAGTDALALLGGTLQRAIFDAARNTTMLNAESEPGARWARHASANACEFCRMMATRGAVYASEAAATRVVGRGKEMSEADRRDRAAGRTRRSGSAKGQFLAGGTKTRGTRKIGDKYHDNCVPAGTLVSGPRTEAAYRRLYEGEAIVLNTASGQQLTITPNHPVLTDEGWVPAGLINEGGNVVRSLGGDSGATAVPHEHQRPALIEDVWRALAVNGFAGMPGAAEDFHGDGSDREVEIVWADGNLNTRSDSAIAEEIEQRLFAGPLGRTPWPELAIEGELAALIPGSGGSANGIMRGFGKSLSLIGGCLGHSDDAGGLRISWLDAHLGQSSPNYRPGCSEVFGALEFGDLVIDVESSKLFGVDLDAVGARFDPAGFEFHEKGVGGYADLGRRLMARLSGHVEVDRVVEKRRIDFSGHVYNLQTENGWYSADSIIVSNCHCTAIEVRPGKSYQPAPYVEQWEQEYQDARKAAAKGEYGAVSAKNLLAAWRQVEPK